MSEEQKQQERLVAAVDDLDLANEIRKRLMFDLKPKACVYVMFDRSRPEDGYSVKISNEWGMYPRDELFEAAQDCVWDLLSGSGDAPDDAVHL